MTTDDISAKMSIVKFFHCGRCLDERPSDQSPREWARLSVGWTKQGFQVWCYRHECNVMHIDFQGHKHPANTDALDD
jgi:hypothetical protein